MYNVQFQLSNFQSKQPHYWTFLYAGTLFRQCLAIFDAGTAFQRTGFSPRLKMSSSVAPDSRLRIYEDKNILIKSVKKIEFSDLNLKIQ